MKAASRRLLAVRLALALAVLAGLALSNWVSLARLARQAAFRGRALSLVGSELALVERALRYEEYLRPGRRAGAMRFPIDAHELARRIERTGLEVVTLARAGMPDRSAFGRRDATTAVEEGALRLAATMHASGAQLAPEAFNKQAEALIRATEVVRDMLERENEDAVHRLEARSLARLGLTLAILFAMAIFILRPLWRALRAEMQRLGRMLDQTLQGLADGVMIVDREGSILELNPAAAALLGDGGWKRDLGGWLERYEARNADGSPMALADLPSHRAVQENKVVETEWRFRPPGENDWRWVMSKAGPLLGANGQIEGAVSIMRDITERRRMEDRLERQSEELARSNAELQAFASIASHELQEPMRKVVAFGDRLRQRFGEQVPPEGREDLDRIQKAAHRMVRLVENLLRYARVDLKAVGFERVPLDEALDEALLDLEARLEATGGSVTRRKLPEVWGDRSQFEQVFGNLLSNALKFTKPGVAPLIEISARDAGDAWELVVADNGIGFEPGYAGLLFEPFSRLHSRDRFEGTGMGLAITRRIALRHGGDIKAEGRPGQGATFTLRLPKRPPEGGTR